MDVSQRKHNKFVGILIICSVVVLLAAAIAVDKFEGDRNSSAVYEESAPLPLLSEDDACNVVVFSLNGFLNTYSAASAYGYEDDYSDVTSSEALVAGLLDVENDESVRGIILTIDSGGGYAAAGEEIAHALQSLTKPNFAVIRSLGASSAYLAASGADKIYASKFSDVGSIGITASYLDETKKNEKDGLTYVELTSARFKDAGNPSHPLTDEEREIILSDISKNHEYFVDLVAENRSLPRETVSEMATGQTFVGQDALSFGLIDTLGDLMLAKKEMGEVVNEDVSLCWY
jgi:signal peptide peptidase SppA